MPSDAEVIRDHYEATNERDFERAMSHYAEDVVLEVSGTGLRSGRFEGREEVGRWFGDWFSTFDDDAHFEIEEVRKRDDGSVQLTAELYARGRSSGVQVHGPVHWTYRLREGKIVRVEGGFGSVEEPQAEGA